LQFITFFRLTWKISAAMQRVRCTSQRWLALLLVSAIAMMAIPAAQAYTDPNNCK
jgi:hypothetical protein